MAPERKPGLGGLLRRAALDLSPLRESPPFRRLWAGQSISYVGSEIAFVAVAIQLYDLTYSTLDVGLLSLCALMPLLVVPIVGGAIADAVDRRRLLLRTETGLAVVSVLLAGNALLPRPQVLALFPAYGAHFGGGARTVGFLYAAPYAGALVASLVSGWATHVRRQGLGVCVAAALWGLALVGFGYADPLWLALGMLALAGAADFVSAVLRSTILLTATPDPLRGRLSGIEFAQVASTPSLGNLEAGVVASLTSLRFSVVSGGIACIAGTVLCALALPRFVRYDSRVPDA